MDKKINVLNEILLKKGKESSFYVGLVVINSEGNVLIGKRREDGIWTGPGGGSDPGETPLETAVREAFEEAQLKIDTERLIPLDTLEAADGRPIICYLYPTADVETSVTLDPDREVPEWNFVHPDDFPKDINKDLNRLKAINNGLLVFYELKKARELNKLLKAKKKDSITEDYHTKHHIAEASRHMAESIKHTELNNKLKDQIKQRKKIDMDYKIPEKAQVFLDESKAKAKGHAEDYQVKKQHINNAQKTKQETVKPIKKSTSYFQLNEILRKGGPGSGKRQHKTLGDKQLQERAKDLKTSYSNWTKRLKEKPGDMQAMQMVDHFEAKIRNFRKVHKLSKSLMGIQENTGVAINTADQAIVETVGKDWLAFFQHKMENYDYGDSPREIDLSDSHHIFLVKVDDGLYSGFVKRYIDEDGVSALEENVAKVEQQSLADIIQYLKTREYLPIDPSPSPTNSETNILTQKLELVKLLDRILNVSSI